MEDKIQTALEMGQLESLEIVRLKSLDESKYWVTNELLDLLCSCDLPDYGLNKLKFSLFQPDCEPFEVEVLIRLA